MRWQEAINLSEVERAVRDDTRSKVFDFWWIVNADGSGDLVNGIRETGISLEPRDRDAWKDWEPEDPKDAVTLLAELTEEDNAD